MWITQNQISLRHPKGPSHTEIWWFTLLSRQQEEDLRQQVAARASHTFGPAGMLEQEDGENWGESTKAARGIISQRYPLNYQMNLGLGQVITEEEGGPPHIETSVNEHAQLWLYRAWAECGITGLTVATEQPAAMKLLAELAGAARSGAVV